MITEYYDLNISPGSVPLIIYISQYDVGFRHYVFTPYGKSGRIEKEDGALVTLEATKSDNNAVIHSCEYNADGTVSYTLQDQLAALSGKVFSRIVFRSADNKILGSGDVIWMVGQAGLADNAELSDSDLSAIEEWVETVVDAKFAAEASEEAAHTSEVNAAASAASANASKIAAASSETNAATSESNAATSESNAATSETNAATSAASALSSKNDAYLSEQHARSYKEDAEIAKNTAVAAKDTAVSKATEASNLVNNFATNIQDYVADAVEDIQVVSGQTVIDKTLKVSGAAADAKVVGDIFEDVASMMVSAPATNLGSVVTFSDAAEGAPVKTFSYNLEPHQAGSGDPSPDNARPISGYTSVDVTRTGKNLLGGLTFGQGIVDAVNVPSNTFLGSDANGDYVQFTAGGALTGKNITPNLRFQPNTQYTLIFALLRVNTDGSTATNIAVAYTNGTKIQITLPTGTTANTKVATVFTTAENRTVDHIELGYYSGTIHLYYDESGIFEGAVTADHFVSYQGITESIPFPSEAGTVYGGTLTKNADGSGTLTVTWAAIDMGTLNWAYSSSNQQYYVILTGMKTGYTSTDNYVPLICEKYAPAPKVGSFNVTDKHIGTGTNGGISNTTVIVMDNTYSDAATFTASLSNAYMAYELETPTTYAVPAEDMAKIPTLNGDNTVWMNADGEFTELTYRINKLIDNTLTETGAPADAKTVGDIIAQNAGITVSKNYDAGALIRVDGAIYKTKTVVVSGETLVPNVNCEATTLVDEIENSRSEIDEAKEDLDTKANKAGNYPDLTAGNANQLVSEGYIEDKGVYLHRRSAGGLEIGDREIDEIVGGTVAWNQLGALSNSPVVARGLTCTLKDDGYTWHVTGTAEANGVIPVLQIVNTVQGHKYYLYASSSWFSSGFQTYSNIGAGGLLFRNAIIAETEGKKATYCIRAEAGRTYDNDVALMIIDLTAMFGPTIADYIYSIEQSTAGAGIAWFRNLFPKNYYEYDPGSLKSVEGLSAHVMRDADNNIVGNYPLDSSIKLQGIFKLDSANRLYADGDIYPSNGQVKRMYREIVLGDLEWLDASISNLFTATLSGMPVYAGNILPKWVVSRKYTITESVSYYPWENKPDKVIGPRANSSYIQIKDSDFSTGTELKQWLIDNDVRLVCELATPTTETADPYTNPQIVDNYGTEEYVTSGIVPVGHNTKYLQDLKSKLESAPDSPDADGDYIMRQTSGVNSYAPLASASAISGLTTRMSTAETQIAQNADDVADLKSAINDHESRLDAIEEADGLHRYGVSGIGQAASALTRLWDAVGMTAQVGTDGDNSGVINNFDDVTPFNRRKCVGSWSMVGGRAVFHVHAYYGDDEYTEDGTMGDYVAVECPRAYYYLKDGVLGVSAHQYQGWRPFDIFCRDHNPEDTIPYVYLPAYALALKDGHAVSLPGLDNYQGSYKAIMDACRTYSGDAGAVAFCQPAAVNFYEWALFTVEFATQNCQSVMQGCAGLRHSNDDRAILRADGKWLLNNYYASRVVGEYVSIQPTDVDQNNSGYYASHRITAIVRCDADGNEDASGTHQLVTTEDLGAGREYTVGEQYRFSARPWRTGSCNGVSTPSGSPVSNNNSYYPMKYRWRENVYSNQYKTLADLFNRRIGSSDSDYALAWYYLLDPSTYTPAATSKPDVTDLETDAFVLLDIETAHENYVNGYIKSKQYSEDYPDIWCPYETTGASSATYFCDYASLVHSHVVRAVRLGGYWSLGAHAGFSYSYAYAAPSSSDAAYGGDLFFPQ